MLGWLVFGGIGLLALVVWGIRQRRKNTKAVADVFVGLIKKHNGLEIGYSRSEGEISFRMPSSPTYNYRHSWISGEWETRPPGSWLQEVENFSFGALKRGWYLLKKDPSFGSREDLDDERRGPTWLFKNPG